MDMLSAVSWQIYIILSLVWVKFTIQDFVNNQLVHWTRD